MAYKYFVKAPISGWQEVDEEHYNRFRKNVLQYSNPKNCTPAEFVERVTRKEEVKE